MAVILQLAWDDDTKIQSQIALTPQVIAMKPPKSFYYGKLQTWAKLK